MWYLPFALGYKFNLFCPSFSGKVFRPYILFMPIALILYIKIKLMNRLFMAIAISASLYSFIGIPYGAPSIGIVESIVSTNKNEAFEQIKSISIEQIVLFSLSIICIFIYNKNSNYSTQKWWIWPIAVAIFYPAFIRGIYLDKFTTNIFFTINNYNKELSELNKNKAIIPEWTFTNKSVSNHKNYVVIIGESARADYFSIYGYPINTTPFLKEKSTTIFDNATSPATNTILSVPRTLSLNSTQYKIKNAYDTVTLAKKAGYETWWISDQGKTGIFDTDITHIAARSDNIKYLQVGDHDSKKVDDFDLLDLIYHALNTENTKNKVIFVHTMGSHHDPCERLGDFPLINGTSNNWSLQLKCYITTIRKTDSFIENVDAIMKTTNAPYEIIYFSDHGVYITNKTMLHSQTVREAYHVPLIVIDSEKKDRTVIPEYFDMRHFIDFFASEIGVKADQIEGTWEKNLHNSDTAITPLSWDKEHLIDLNTLESNPAITP